MKDEIPEKKEKKKKNSKLHGIISGLMDYLELKFNNELWWNRDD